jgi:hypothetical protein
MQVRAKEDEQGGGWEERHPPPPLLLPAASPTHHPQVRAKEDKRKDILKTTENKTYPLCSLNFLFHPAKVPVT